VTGAEGRSSPTEVARCVGCRDRQDVPSGLEFGRVDHDAHAVAVAPRERSSVDAHLREDPSAEHAGAYSNSCRGHKLRRLLSATPESGRVESLSDVVVDRDPERQVCERFERALDSAAPAERRHQQRTLVERVHPGVGPGLWGGSSNRPRGPAPRTRPGCSRAARRSRRSARARIRGASRPARTRSGSRAIPSRASRAGIHRGAR
jgi:hypothetical protein